MYLLFMDVIHGYTSLMKSAGTQHFWIIVVKSKHLKPYTRLTQTKCFRRSQILHNFP